MSEFKFACPVCGQHITADAGNSGAQIECPTCFKKLVVPQPPAAATSHLVLTAVAADRPRIPIHETPPEQVAPKRNPAAPVIFAVLIAVAAAGAVVAAKSGFFKSLSSSKPAPDDSAAGTSSATASPTPTQSIPRVSDATWTLDLASAKTPEARVSGRIHGRDFDLSRAVLVGGLLNLRQGTAWPPELGLSVYLFAKAGEELSGQTVEVSADRPHGPRVMLRWKDADKTTSKSFSNGYAMRLEFGQAAGGRMPGKLFLAAPDEAKSVVAGTFDAEIRKPSPPKPKTGSQPKKAQPPPPPPVR